MMDFARARRTMVDCQVRTFDVTDRAVLAAMGEVPRERFMPAGRESIAYGDGSVMLGPAGTDEARILLAPMVLARMIQALEIAPGDRVLDVASGTGYASAVLAALGAAVVALDQEPPAGIASDGTEGPGRVVVRIGPIAAGCPQDAPFDAILINGAVGSRPETLIGQLAVGGRLACLERDGRTCRAMLYMRSGEGSGSRALFDATAPVLSAFEPARAFTF